MAIVLPDSFGRYRILKPLGEGGMGAVFLAKDQQLDRLVALKVPKLEQMAGTDSEALKRFFREARSAATLRHPNICPIYDIGEFSGTPFLTMAFIEGQTLASLVTPGKPMNQRQAMQIIDTLARAMEEAHSRGVIHRDLKPSNVMMTARGEPVIMDFGLAHRDETIEANLTKSGALLGTPAYMAPEQIEGGARTVGPATEVYTMGVILYQLLTTRLPFEGSVMSMLGQILYHEPEPPSKYRPDLDRALEQICLKAMAKQPKDRYASMADLAVALERWLSRSEGENDRRWPWWAKVLVGAAACGALLAATYLLNETFLIGKVPVVLSQPDVAAEVRLDGVPVDRARLGELLRLQPGEHKLEVRGEGYQLWSQILRVRRGLNPPVHVALEAASAPPPVVPREATKQKQEPPSQVPGPSRVSPTVSEPKALLSNAGPSAPSSPVPKQPATKPSSSPPPSSRPSPTSATVPIAARPEPKPGPRQPAKSVTNTIGMTLVLIPAGSFAMGSPDGTGEDDEHPKHEVRISRPFYLAIHEVTQSQYRAVTGMNPSWFSAKGGGKETVKELSTDQYPVESVSWFDALRFCNRLSEQEGIRPFYAISELKVQVLDWNGTGYRLPTEAEWEYACRAASRNRYSFGDDESELPRHGWFGDALDRGTHAVGQKPANIWGVCDMHGNVWEWCWDWFGAAYYKESTPVDARGPEEGVRRIRRGGGFNDAPSELRAAIRASLQPAIRSRLVGFRVARDPS